MKNVFVLDACSLIALLTNENGADIVKSVLQKAVETDTEIMMHKVNFLEVYYYIHKNYNEEAALKLFDHIKMSPIKINDKITDEILIRAGRLKALYKISLADSIGLAEAILNNGYFVTADHHELDMVQEKEEVNILWIRERNK